MLEIDTVYKKGILFVKMYGVINNKTKDKIEYVLESAINKVGIKYLFLNFDNVYYMDIDISKIIEKWNIIVDKIGGKIFVCGNDMIKRPLIKFDGAVEYVNDEISAYNMVEI